MAWNPAPEVAMARDFAKKFGAKRVVIMYDMGDKFAYASYGENRGLCDSAKRIAEWLWSPFREAIVEENDRMYWEKSGTVGREKSE